MSDVTSKPLEKVIAELPPTDGVDDTIFEMDGFVESRPIFDLKELNAECGKCRAKAADLDEMQCCPIGDSDCPCKLFWEAE